MQIRIQPIVECDFPINVLGYLYRKQVSKYKFGNKYTTQKQIKSYNASIKSYCSTLKNVKYIDATSGFINSNGYLKYQDPEGTHISWQYLGKYYNNIEAAVNRVR